MSSKYKGSRNEIIALDSYIKLSRATESINSKISRLLLKNGFTESQFKVLDALYHLGPLPQKILAKKLLKSGGNITMVIDNLEKRGVVERRRGSDDRRLFTIQLTKKGFTQIKKLMPLVVEVVYNEIKVLTNGEQNELQSMCKKIGLKQS
ncbi:MarR family winged helix-turn-helix transcriptional regulator [Bacteroidota bacterium]